MCSITHLYLYVWESVWMMCVCIWGAILSINVSVAVGFDHALYLLPFGYSGYTFILVSWVVIAHVLVSHVWAVDEYYRVGCSVCCTVAVLPLLCGCVSCPFKAYLKPCLCHKHQELYSHPSTVLPRAMHFHVCKLLAENTRFCTCFYHTFLRNCSA